MKKFSIALLVLTISLCSCSSIPSGKPSISPSDDSAISAHMVEISTFNEEYYRGFSMDNVLVSNTLGEIHYNVYVPDSYDGKKSYALYFTLPGYQGLYRFGVGANLRTETFAFEAMNYVKDMIIVAPQLNDWGVTSARQTIELVHWFIDRFNIDRERVFANGYSGGGETMSTAMGIEPKLFSRYLHCSSQWNGDLGILVKGKTPVYLAIGENDEYYGSTSTVSTYNDIVSLYRRQGLSDPEINSLVTLDVKNHDYFTSMGIENEHGGGGRLFATDPGIMGWLFH